jgi:phosphatidylglycerophosphate synthase
MRQDIPPLAEVRRTTQKKRDAWWTVLLVDPLATRLVRLAAVYTRVTPNQLTWGAFVLGLGSAACFALGDWRWLIIGALLYHLSFILDCMDGKLARLTGQGSAFGAWLDFIFDRIRVFACGISLMAGQYARTGEVKFAWLALVVVGFDAFRYYNSLEIFKVRQNMRKQIRARLKELRQDESAPETAFMEDLLRADTEADIALGRGEADGGVEAFAAEQAEAFAAESAESEPAVGESAAGESAVPSGKQVVDLQKEFRHRFPGYLRIRSWLLQHRIRTHLISGIEYQMGVFIVGPLLDAPVAATLASGGLLLVFELAIVYKLFLSTRDFTRTMDSLAALERPVSGSVS